MVKTITAEELFRKVKAEEALVLVDVRAEDKYNHFHIEANTVEDINVPKTEIFTFEDEVEKVIPQLPKNKGMIITCTTGNSATKCANILADRDYDVTVLEGGITAWKEYVSNESIERMWEEFKRIHPNAPEQYEAWSFGNSKQMADELAELVVEGTKTATSSNYTLYEIEDEPLPMVGLHNIILDGEGMAVAVVKTTSVKVVPFNKVTEEHAYLEGEGDRSLHYWQEVHKEFFENELKEVNQDFHREIPVVCETFELLYKNETSHRELLS
ncbi:ASCH domain-containing protein [Sporosarcina sp. P3]|uniref:ASCH domain-containing protein n=1 Tax=Sporosarcina sp. P3 TaxID=2048245 RepID=UPI0013044765